MRKTSCRENHRASEKDLEKEPVVNPCYSFVRKREG
jgi:hypothetical protein